MLTIGAEAAPPFDKLTANTDTDSLGKIVRASGLDRAGSLLSEARDVRLAVTQERRPTQ